MLLEFNPGLAKYSTFHGLNFPLHFTSAKSHNEIMTLLLENGVDVNLRNYCGQSLGGGADSAHLQKHYMYCALCIVSTCNLLGSCFSVTLHKVNDQCRI
ncbi:E3 ubiquitin-protein ligase XBAT33-like isoform X6 [Zingiber officinale]|uniref:E3 ubiquitin-protein ligase XBAT33-like isoform X6 n=1 Tax=Zingiber officinale TaxID=94328 RepID=UPI001C4D82C0|nr:E3 ubiquitin-protein ligase XBAT33-like isoform X6 [Zingiber officinale]XP_042474048.1 E3 ubiquitin-protein ligase XBAT33-like isoform X6 [Zingiber officinale]